MEHFRWLTLSSVFLLNFLIICSSDPLPITKKCIMQAALITPYNNECTYKAKSSHLSSEALSEVRDKYIVFMGESTLRQLFLQFIGIIDSQPWNQIPDQKQNKIIQIRKSGSRFVFHYTSYYANITAELQSGLPQLSDGRMPDVLILNDALHDLLYNSKEAIEKSWTDLKNAIILLNNDQYPEIPIIWVPPPFIYDKHLTKHRKTAEQFTNASIAKMVDIQKEFFLSSDLHNAYFYDIFRNVSFDAWNFDGMHDMQRANKEAQGLLRTFHALNNEPIAWQRNTLTINQILCFLVYFLVFAIVVSGEISLKLFFKTHVNHQTVDEISKNETEPFLVGQQSTTDSSNPNAEECNEIHHRKPEENADKSIDISVKKTNGNGDKHSLERTLSPSSSASISEENLISLPSMLDYNLFSLFIHWYKQNAICFRAMLNFGFVVIVVYLMDGPNGHFFIVPSLKKYNRDFFIFLHIIFLAISLLTFKKNESKDKNAILSRLQTEEWKGIMQIIFVMYHYFDASEIYNLIRVFIDAYVWMTGYGNTRFFIGKNIFNLTRVFGMLFRLNWLVFWICLILNQPLMHYYICPLHTFFFLMCYFTWGIAYEYNSSVFGKFVKLSVCLLFLIIVFETPSEIFFNIFAPLRFVLSEFGSLHNWYFRTSLDHFATWYGMVFAVCYNSLYAMVERLETRITHQEINAVFIKYSIIGVCFISSVVWYVCVYRNEKYTYNLLNPYFAIIPIMSYIIVRNIVSKKYRAWYSGFLSNMGQITLETYIFQYHLFMIDDAKSILTVVSGYPLCNFMIVSVLYLWLSRIAFQTTDVLRKYFYPVRKNVSNLQVAVESMKYVFVLGVLYVCAICIGFMMGLSLFGN